MSVQLDKKHSLPSHLLDLKNQNTKEASCNSLLERNEENKLQSHQKTSISVLKSMSDIRPDKVALGKNLVQDDKYPDDDVLDKVANALLGEQEE